MKNLKLAKSLILFLAWMSIVVVACIGFFERYDWFNVDVDYYVTLPSSEVFNEVEIELPWQCNKGLDSQRVEIKKSHSGDVELRCSTIDTHLSFWPFIEKVSVDPIKFQRYETKLGLNH